MAEPHAVEELVPTAEVRAADWITARLDRSGNTVVGIVVPPGFAAYARILHPASDEQERNVRWSDVARANGRDPTAATRWADVIPDESTLDNGEQPGLWYQPPDRGSLPTAQAARLAELLRAHTTTPDRCWFGVWDGWAALRLPRGNHIPRIQCGYDRPMLLLSGPLSAATTSLESPPFDQRANLWWPDDHAWCVATEIDLETTFLGGSAACVDAVLADESLESFRVAVV